MKQPSRVWTYSRQAWTPGGWERWGWPYRGGDEWGRRTVVVGLWFVGYLVVAYWTCRCEDCDEARRESAEWITGGSDE